MDRLSEVFNALADPTRRAILARLAQGEATVNELAEPFPISLQAVSKHLKVLERAGLITRGKQAQWRPCRLDAEPLREVAEWVTSTGASGRSATTNWTSTSHAYRRGTEMSDTLTVTLPSDLEIKMVRVFDAPRELVFEAHTKPEHLKHWWGRGNPLDCEMDFRPGGSYRFVEHAPDGQQYAFRGEYREIQPPERIVQTFEFESMPGHVCVETLELTEQDGKTTVTSVTRFDTKDERDGMIESGMADGARESYDALAVYLTKLS